MLKQGDKAPLDIELKNLAEEVVTLKDYLDKEYLVVYFYPKDDTEGCTKEACNFRDFKSEIEALDARVVGISKDSIKSHLKFKNKYKLNFELLSDESLELQKAFGVWAEKTMFGKNYMGTLRTTFVLDKNGTVVKVWEKVTPENHGEGVLKYLNLDNKSYLGQHLF